MGLLKYFHSVMRGAKRRGNPGSGLRILDWIASLRSQ
jgi:hypothetical protein